MRSSLAHSECEASLGYMRLCLRREKKEREGRGKEREKRGMKKGKRERGKGRKTDGERGRGREDRAILRLQINRECDYNPMAEGADTRNLKVFTFLK